MTNLKVILATPIVASLIIGGSGFTDTKLYSKYYYVSGVACQRLSPGHSLDPDPRERSLASEVFTDTASWTTNSQSYQSTNNYSAYIGSISFAEEATADGGSDGRLTLQEAVDAVYNGYISNSPSKMNQSIIVDQAATVYILAAEEVH